MMGDASEEKVPSAISSVDAEEEWMSASWSVIHGISLHPHVENALPDGDAYVIVCEPSLGVKQTCWSANVVEEEWQPVYCASRLCWYVLDPVSWRRFCQRVSASVNVVSGDPITYTAVPVEAVQEGKEREVKLSVDEER